MQQIVLSLENRPKKMYMTKAATLNPNWKRQATGWADAQRNSGKAALFNYCYYS